ncbi:MAG: prepilin-type N-terminal cleavage/methylation domain-containing protein [Planctomycetales bacterium]|nr:prepilin-type N-terminal cleavage/methylation domain-containing protein [Planctomycetales bacterium]
MNGVQLLTHDRRRKSTSRRLPTGFSLLELLAVVTLLGVMGAAVTMRYGRDTLSNAGARSEARRISLGMLQAQRAAIRTGTSHGVKIYGGNSWAVVSVGSGGSRTIVDGPHVIDSQLQLTTNSDEVVFDFEGNGTSVFQAVIKGKDRTWQLRVLPLTRMIDSREVSN